ncbi:hypothetical protein BDP27DRAFT_1450881 [Rhodocollybia butyracea]|uniref:Uncharacterized protein n=1 Tax=Rhodocollybia butyracea TaxID=206335 RepID=A0A9P5U3X2_9AGAR|nr:hypothetical protein BDP27DRAFT_1450881 [Rhodocollybia butyracea]
MEVKETHESANKYSSVRSEHAQNLEKNMGLLRDLTMKPLILPWEILDLIFQRVLAPSVLMAPDMYRFSAWSFNLWMANQLVNVCHDWYRVGISFLYSDIAIYWIGQLFALEQTLRHRPDLANKVLTIRFALYVPPKYVNGLEHSAASLASLCPRLASVFVQPMFSANPHLSSQLIPAFSKSHLTHLAICCDNELSVFHATSYLHLVADQLISLIMYPRTTPSPATATLTEVSQPLQFPHLKSFNCHLNHMELALIIQNWSFPKLDTLAFLNMGDSFPSYQDVYYEQNFIHSLKFILVHGRNIRTLLLQHCPVSRPEYPTLLGELLAALPDLRHLIIPSVQDFALPQLRYLDLIQLPSDAQEHLEVPKVEDRIKRFPSLISCRFVDQALLTLPWIYQHLHPSFVGSFGFRFPGIDIRGDDSTLWGTSSSERSVLTKDIFDADSSQYSSDNESSDSSDSEADCHMSDESDECLEDEGWSAREASEIGLSVWRGEVYARAYVEEHVDNVEDAD